MPINRTGVSTAAEAASSALELLSKVIEVSKPSQQDAWLAAARQEAETLRRAAAEDVAAYNAYLERVRASAGPEELQAAFRTTIEIPLQAARAAVAGIELCVAVAESVRVSVAADLGVAASLLAGAVRGMLLCLDANLRIVPSPDAFCESALAERTSIEEREERAVHDVVRLIRPRV